MREETRRHFDSQARDYYRSNYEQPRTRHAYNLALRREACLALVPSPGGTVLDLGCGPGAMTIPLVESGHRVVWTDVSSEMVAETSKRASALGAPVRGAVADAAALPFDANSFATVVTTGVLEYVPNLSATMTEIARVLEPCGVLIATMSLPRRFERFAVRSLAKLRGRSTSIEQFIYERAPFDEIIESAGLRIEIRQCCAFAPFPVDAIWPRSVLWIDRVLGASLNRVEIACDHAKTYIVRARAVK
jgi:ubiquinone/menaquinone biosynthesis C-methylase UbiE